MVFLVRYWLVFLNQVLTFFQFAENYKKSSTNFFFLPETSIKNFVQQEKIGKLIFQMFQNIAHRLGQNGWSFSKVIFSAFFFLAIVSAYR